MEISKQALDNLKQLGYEIHPVTDGELNDLVPRIGYESYGLGTDYDDGTKGVLMHLPENANKYNNGVYMLHKLAGGEIVMEVIVPNDRDKGALVQKFVDQISNHIDGLDTFDLTVFDYTEIFGLVLANSVVKPLAKTLFPDDKLKQAKFADLYMPRFLSNMAHMYVGDGKLFEEGVNSEPYVVKIMIDNATNEHVNEKSAKDKSDDTTKTTKKSDETNKSDKASKSDNATKSDKATKTTKKSDVESTNSQPDKKPEAEKSDKGESAK